MVNLLHQRGLLAARSYSVTLEPNQSRIVETEMTTGQADRAKDRQSRTVGIFARPLHISQDKNRVGLEQLHHRPGLLGMTTFDEIVRNLRRNFIGRQTFHGNFANRRHEDLTVRVYRKFSTQLREL